jgi:hypothetical protein
MKGNIIMNNMKISYRKELLSYYNDQKKDRWGVFQNDEALENMTFNEWVEYEYLNGKEYDDGKDWKIWIDKLEQVFKVVARVEYDE